MAKRLKRDSNLPGRESDTPTEATRFHNAKHRKELIAGYVEEIRGYEAQVAALQEQAKEIKKNAAEVYKVLKTELGLKRKNVNIVLHLMKLDAEEHDEAIDQIREAYEALRPGEQASLFPALDPVAD